MRARVANASGIARRSYANSTVGDPSSLTLPGHAPATTTWAKTPIVGLPTDGSRLGVGLGVGLGGGVGEMLGVGLALGVVEGVGELVMLTEGVGDGVALGVLVVEGAGLGRAIGSYFTR